MAIQPFRRRVGVPGAAPLVPVRTVNIPDIGRQISSVGQAIFQAGEQERILQAQEAGQLAAAETPIRDPEGNLISAMPETTGGIVKQQAYQRALAANYLSAFNFDLQKSLDDLANNPEYRNKPDELFDLGRAHIEGVLSSVPVEFRAQAQEIALREGQQRFSLAADRYAREQYTSTISGLTSKISLDVQEYTRLSGDPNATSEQREAVVQRAMANVFALREMGKTDVEVDAILQSIRADFGTADELTISMENMLRLSEYVGASNSPEELAIIRNWLIGVPSDDAIAGSINLGNQTIEATPEYAREKLTELFPSVNITSGARGPNHPLSQANPGSYHNTRNGGRAFDVAPIDGVTFEEYVTRLRAAGFNIVEAIDETTPEAMARTGATGPHWHIAYGPLFQERVTGENATARNLTFNSLHEMLPSRAARADMAQVINGKISDLRQEESERAAALREQARLEQAERQHRELISSIEESTRDGVYNYTNRQTSALNTAFNSAVESAGGLNTDSGRAAAIGFISEYAFMPNSMKGWFTSNLRNPNSFMSALNLYNSVRNVTTATGANMGDVLIGPSSLNAADRGLFDVAIELHEAGVEEDIIKDRIQGIISGTGYTSTEARQQFNNLRGDGEFQREKTKMLQEVYGFEDGEIFPADLSRRYDETFAANLAAHENNVDRALEATREQMSGGLVANPVFFNGVGYKRLFETIGGTPRDFNQILYNYLSTLRYPDGSPLMGRYAREGVTRGHTIGGPNSTIRLRALDGNVTGLGRYEIIFFDPTRPTQRLGTYRIDMGGDGIREAAAAYGRRQRNIQEAQNAAAVAAAREQRRREEEAGARAMQPQILRGVGR